jgi:hypothetical protein
MDHTLSRNEKSKIWAHSLFISLLLTLTWTFKLEAIKELSFWYQDWYLAYQLIDYSRDSVSSMELTTHIAFTDSPLKSEEINGIFGNRVFAIGMLIFSPDVLIFPFLSITDAIIWHISLTVGAISLVTSMMLMRRNLSIAATYFLAISFFLMVPMIARLSVGHIQLLGYLLIPIFIILLQERRKLGINCCNLWMLKMSALLTYVISLGSVHVFFQMTLILGIYFVFNPRHVVNLSAPIVASLSLTSFQTLPALLDRIEGGNRSVYHGYGFNFFSNTNFNDRESVYDFSSFGKTLNTLYLHLQEIVIHLWLALTSSDYALANQGWEWTMDIGPVTILMILTFVILNNRRLALDRENAWTLVCFFLSLSLFYRFIYLAVADILPLSPIDRIPFRMLTYPILWLMLVCTFFWDSKITTWTSSKKKGAYFFSLLALMNYFYLISLFESWTNNLFIEDSKMKYQNSGLLPKYNEISVDYDSDYIFHIQIGFVISIFSMICLTLLWKKTRKD